jgi:hypothetical protein
MNLETRKPGRVESGKPGKQESRKAGMFSAVHGFPGSRCFPLFLLS